MAEHPNPASRGRKSGGPSQGRDFNPQDGPEPNGPYLTVPPEDRKDTGATPGVARAVRALVVRDAAGRIVSVTKVAPDAKFGVGVKPPPGHTVTEVDAGTLAEDPFDVGGRGMRSREGPGEPGRT